MNKTGLQALCLLGFSANRLIAERMLEMSVNTAASEAIDKTREHLDGAIDNIAQVVIGRCWGHEEYSPQYMENLRSALSQLIQMREAV
jgi:hypothetical protein